MKPVRCWRDQCNCSASAAAGTRQRRRYRPRMGELRQGSWQYGCPIPSNVSIRCSIYLSYSRDTFNMYASTAALRTSTHTAGAAVTRHSWQNSARGLSFRQRDDLTTVFSNFYIVNSVSAGLFTGLTGDLGRAYHAAGDANQLRVGGVERNSPDGSLFHSMEEQFFRGLGSVHNNARRCFAASSVADLQPGRLRRRHRTGRSRLRQSFVGATEWRFGRGFLRVASSMKARPRRPEFPYHVR